MAELRKKSKAYIAVFPVVKPLWHFLHKQYGFISETSVISRKMNWGKCLVLKYFGNLRV